MAVVAAAEAAALEAAAGANLSRGHLATERYLPRQGRVASGRR